MALLEHQLTPHYFDMMAPILIRDVESGEDTISWGPSPSGTFSTKSTYELATTEPRDRVGGPWKQIWKYKVTPRINTLLWVVLHGKLMTNMERFKIKISLIRTLFKVINLTCIYGSFRTTFHKIMEETKFFLSLCYSLPFNTMTT